jgi:hypothetical protein
MSQSTTAELEKLGRDAAQQVAGDDAVAQVEVVPGEDSDERPVYYFSFLIDQDRARQRPGLVWIRLVQRLQDELVARGDGHYPVIRILDRTDWDKRAGAQSQDLAAEATSAEGIRQGLEDLRSGRTRHACEVFDKIRAEHGIPL